MAEEPAAAEQAEASAEAAIAAAAITLETVHAAIAAESDAAEDRQEELLQEVRKCLTKLEQLSASVERGAESPSLQQLLIQAGQIQTSLEAIQEDLTALQQSPQPDGVAEVTINENSPPQSLKPSASPISSEGGKPEPGERPPQTPPRSSPSPTPASKKRHYVKI